MIARFDLTAIEALKDALPRFTHKPLPHLSYLKPNQIEGYWLDDIAQELNNEGSTGFASYARTASTVLCFTAILHGTRKSLENQ
jgi:hypothetical protein